MAFQIGDVVEMINEYNEDQNDSIHNGDTGVVAKISPITGRIGVAWDKNLAIAHNLDGACEKGHGWWVQGTCLAVVEREAELHADDFGDLSELLGF